MFGSFPPSPLVVSASKVYSGLGADIVYGIITFKFGSSDNERLSHLVNCETFRPIVACHGQTITV